MVLHSIVPPYLLERLEQTVDDPNLRARYRLSRQQDAVLRTRPAAGLARSTEAVGLRREVYDAQSETNLPGQPARSEGADPVPDQAVNQAYDGTGATWTLYSECFGRDSIDGQGLVLTSSVHYDRGYANAFWDGAQMVFGDGDGEIFGNFTASVDVTGHELTHGVTQYTANLSYEGQPGALNESISDVFGSLAKQYQLGQSTAEADWLIGAGLFLPGVQGVALRSMKAPGTAYDDPRLGKDPQPGHMSGYVETSDDNGGVHLNSGIPNRAFYLTAEAIGGNAYDAAGKIWYLTLTAGALPPTATFAVFAQATQSAATQLFGETSAEATAVTQAWQTVGVLPTNPSTPQPPGSAATTSPVGSAGTTSPVGSAGTTSPAGSAGTTSPAGSAGTTSPPGSAGTTSPPGSAGTTSPVGSAGTTSPAGAGGSPADAGSGDGAVGSSGEAAGLMRAAQSDLPASSPPAPPPSSGSADDAD